MVEAVLELTALNGIVRLTSLLRDGRVVVFGVPLSPCIRWPLFGEYKRAKVFEQKSVRLRRNNQQQRSFDPLTTRSRSNSNLYNGKLDITFHTTVRCVNKYPITIF